MPLDPLPVVDTRAFFRPLAAEFVNLIATLDDVQWQRTAVGAWRVRDVVAHMIDTTLRRLSFHRDRHAPPPPDHPIREAREFTAFINALNADWVRVSQRLSPPVLTALYAQSATWLADFAEAFPIDAPALFPVSWAGQDASAGWLDLGREFTEHWHHQQQVRDAVGARPPSNPAWLHALLAVSVRALPQAYAGLTAPEGTTVLMEVSGDAGGCWGVRREHDAWRVWQASPDAPADARAELSDDAAWRLFFNGLPAARVEAEVRTVGNRALLAPLLSARAVIV